MTDDIDDTMEDENEPRPDKLKLVAPEDDVPADNAGSERWSDHGFTVEECQNGKTGAEEAKATDPENQGHWDTMISFWTTQKTFAEEAGRHSSP